MCKLQSYGLYKYDIIYYYSLYRTTDLLYGKPTTLETFFKRKALQNLEINEPTQVLVNEPSPIPGNEHPFKVPRIENEEIDISLLEKDLGKHC